MKTVMRLVEKGWVPEPIVRLGIRRMLAQRLRDEEARHTTSGREFVAGLIAAPIAEVPELPNAQHYEVPAGFYERVLGRHLKYSCSYWPEGLSELDDAEASMLDLTVQRAQLEDGQRILELGCGWGSLTLWMAEHFPNAEIVAVSNSAPQREYIVAQALQRGIVNLRVITADMNDFDTDERFDRIVSVEMFEHMRNWPRLLGRVRHWLTDDGRVFIHVFAHSIFAYPYETTAADDWMGRTFFTGGMMPSVDLIDRLESPFDVVERWKLPGTHYEKTAEAWLANLIRHRREIVEIFASELPQKDAERQWERWRLFFYALSESFGYRSGTEWVVAHYLLAPSTKGEQP